jgi:hypothetical protein
MWLEAFENKGLMRISDLRGGNIRRVQKIT